MFEARDFRSDDYIDFGSWLESRGRTPAKIGMLPNDGVVIESENEKVAIGFFLSVGKIAVVMNLASNPASEKREDGVNFLLECMIKKARGGDHEMIVISTNKPKFIERLTGHGFTILDEGLVQMGLMLT